jgi:hypothetical protein
MTSQLNQMIQKKQSDESDTNSSSKRSRRQRRRQTKNSIESKKENNKKNIDDIIKSNISWRSQNGQFVSQDVRCLSNGVVSQKIVYHKNKTEKKGKLDPVKPQLNGCVKENSTKSSDSVKKEECVTTYHSVPSVLDKKNIPSSQSLTFKIHQLTKKASSSVIIKLFEKLKLMMIEYELCQYIINNHNKFYNELANSNSIITIDQNNKIMDNIQKKYVRILFKKDLLLKFFWELSQKKSLCAYNKIYIEFSSISHQVIIDEHHGILNDTQASFDHLKDRGYAGYLKYVHVVDYKDYKKGVYCVLLNHSNKEKVYMHLPPLCQYYSEYSSDYEYLEKLEESYNPKIRSNMLIFQQINDIDVIKIETDDFIVEIEKELMSISNESCIEMVTSELFNCIPINSNIEKKLADVPIIIPRKLDDVMINEYKKKAEERLYHLMNMMKQIESQIVL